MRTIYGINPVREALRAGNSVIENIFIAANKKSAQIEEIEKLAHSKKIRVTRCDTDKLGEISGTKKDQGIAAVL